MNDKSCRDCKHSDHKHDKGNYLRAYGFEWCILVEGWKANAKICKFFEEKEKVKKNGNTDSKV